MRDENRGLTGFAKKLANFVAHFNAQTGVERGKRFVKEDQLRRRRQRPRQCDALLLPAGKLVRSPFAITGQTDHLQKMVDPFGAFPARAGRERIAAPAAQPKADVVADIKMGEKRAFLRHDSDIAPFGRNVNGIAAEHAARQRDFAAVGPVKPGDDSQQRGFAAPRRAEDGGELAAAHGEIDIAQRPHRLRASGKGFGDSPDRDQRRGHRKNSGGFDFSKRGVQSGSPFKR